MDTLKIIVLSLLASCRPATLERGALLDDCPCPCPPTVDAAIDAQTDASTQIDLQLAWTRTVLTPSSASLRGADGVATDADGCWSTPWEQGNVVTRVCPVVDTWVTEVVANVSAPEDAKAADLDGDGVLDVVIAAAQRVHIAFRDTDPGTLHTPIILGASAGHGNVMQVAIADVNADGHLDIFMGTTTGSPAVVAWLENPGPADARLGIMWDYHPVSNAGWVMSLLPTDVNGDSRMDVVVSDRAKIGASDWSLYGARWMEQMSDGTWALHTIAGGANIPANGRPAGSCSPYASTSCLKTPGDEMMLSVSGDAVYDCTSTSSQIDSRISIHRTTDWLTWTHELVPAVANVGHCQHVLPYDVDLDGDIDIGVTTWKGGSYPVPEPVASRSGVYWLRNNGDGTYSRGEVSGPTGGKFDNAVLLGRCIVTSEQLDPLNGIGVAMYCPPGVP